MESLFQLSKAIYFCSMGVAAIYALKCNIKFVKHIIKRKKEAAAASRFLGERVYAKVNMKSVFVGLGQDLFYILTPFLNTFVAFAVLKEEAK